MAGRGDLLKREPDKASTSERRRRYRRGGLAEFVAGTWLVGKGYWILGRRWKSHFGEIDLIAVRGRYLVFVEVKRRATFEAAEHSITPRQRKRVREAADVWVARHPRYGEHEIRFDLVFVVPGRCPRHIVDGL